MARGCQATGCSNRLTGAPNQKFCSDRCRNRESKRRYRESQQVALIEPSKIKRGDAYQTLMENPKIVELLDRGELTQKAAAHAIGVGQSTFSEDYATFLMDNQLEILAEEWVIDEQVAQDLAIGPYDFDGDLEAWLDRAVEGFVRWRHRNFRTPRGPYITKAFHRRWIRSVLKAIILGGRQQILSPPRHGKSELLIHFVVWLIARNPEFRIIWVSKNEPIAKIMTAEIKRILEHNEALIAETLPPGVTWAPQGRNKTMWGVTRFTVANRDQSISNKAATVTAIGRGGSLVSLDVDLIVLDDIEDYDSTQGEDKRESTRHWMYNNVESRKEDHTAWLSIGSRQHPDDYYDYLLNDDEWDSIVDSAHSVECHLDPDDTEAHVECMLFPEIRTYSWLMSKRRTAENQGLLANYEMVYLNDPRPTGMVVFSEEAVKRSYNKGRGFGLDGMRKHVAEALDMPYLNVNYHLVAGLDPSGTGYQAAVLWAWVPELNKLYLIDASNRKGGGIYSWFELIVEWWDQYELAHWVYENNIMNSDDVDNNTDIQAFCDDHGIYLEPHNTQGGNRNNPIYGVGAMHNLYDENQIDLPFGDEPSRTIITLLTRQMIRFVDNATVMRRSTRKTDLLMASWFPMSAIRRFRSEHSAEAVDDGEFSFADYDTSDFEEAPW